LSSAKGNTIGAEFCNRLTIDVVVNVLHCFQINFFVNIKMIISSLS
jgi:hypothetical protein